MPGPSLLGGGTTTGGNEQTCRVAVTLPLRYRQERTRGRRHRDRHQGRHETTRWGNPQRRMDASFFPPHLHEACEVKANLQGRGVLGSGYDSSQSPQHGPSDILGQHTPKLSAGGQHVQHRKRQQHPQVPDPLGSSPWSAMRTLAAADCVGFAKPPCMQSIQSPTVYVCILAALANGCR